MKIRRRNEEARIRSPGMEEVGSVGDSQEQMTALVSPTLEQSMTTSPPRSPTSRSRRRTWTGSRTSWPGGRQEGQLRQLHQLHQLGVHREHGGLQQPGHAEQLLHQHQLRLHSSHSGWGHPGLVPDKFWWCGDKEWRVLPANDCRFRGSNMNNNYFRYFYKF